MTKQNQQRIKEIGQKIAEDFQPEKIILFGSWAWGEPGPDSDMDLFVVKKTNDTRKLAREIDASLFPRHFPIDVIVYKPEQVERQRKTGDFFINDVINKGKVLYAK